MEACDITDSPRSSLGEGSKVPQNRKGSVASIGREVRFESESIGTEISFHLSPSSILKTIGNVTGSGKLIPGNLTSSNIGGKGGLSGMTNE